MTRAPTDMVEALSHAVGWPLRRVAMPEMSQCPCCGGTPEHGCDEPGTTSWIRCSRCGLMLPNQGERSWAEMCAAWNKRPGARPRTAAEHALADAKDALDAVAPRVLSDAGSVPEHYEVRRLALALLRAAATELEMTPL